MRINTTGDVSVASGATLGGDGTLGGSTTVSGIIAPGNSIGTLSVLNTLTWNGSAGNDWQFELGAGAVSLAAANAATDSDLLNITGNFEQSGSVWQFNFEDTGTEGWFKLVDWSGTTGFDVSDFTYTNLGSGLSGSFTLDAPTSALYFNVIPEPATGLLMAMGAAALAMTIRRRRDD